ncbi:MAG TPA: MBL fold metallo-hydrolase, partial [Rhizomicrobium sp.]
MKRAATIVGIILVMLIAGGWLATRSASFDFWLYHKLAAHLVAVQPDPLAKNGELSVLLCGTNAPLPDPHRAGACTVIAAGNDLYVVDAGLSSVANLLTWRVPLGQVKGVLLTHFHSDHIAELGELR